MKTQLQFRGTKQDGTQVARTMTVTVRDDRYAMIDEARAKLGSLFGECYYPSWHFPKSIPQVRISAAAKRAVRNAGPEEQ